MKGESRARQVAIKLPFVLLLAIKQSNENGISAVSNEAEPLSYALVRNYPNPFSP